MKKAHFRVVVEEGRHEGFYYVDTLSDAYALVCGFASHHRQLSWCVQYSERCFDGPIKHIARGRTFVTSEIES